MPACRASSATSLARPSGTVTRISCIVRCHPFVTNQGRFHIRIEVRANYGGYGNASGRCAAFANSELEAYGGRRVRDPAGNRVSGIGRLENSKPVENRGAAGAGSGAG